MILRLDSIFLIISVKIGIRISIRNPTDNDNSNFNMFQVCLKFVEEMFSEFPAPYKRLSYQSVVLKQRSDDRYMYV